MSIRHGVARLAAVWSFLAGQEEAEVRELIKAIPKERISERAQITNVPVPQTLEEPDAPVSQSQEETVEVIQPSRQNAFQSALSRGSFPRSASRSVHRSSILGRGL